MASPAQVHSPQLFTQVESLQHIDDMRQSLDTATSGNDEVLNSRMLRLELVDPDQQLYPQSSFVLFPKLPTEVRLERLFPFTDDFLQTLQAESA
jgi:hypothetical protein